MPMHLLALGFVSVFTAVAMLMMFVLNDSILMVMMMTIAIEKAIDLKKKQSHAGKDETEVCCFGKALKTG